MDLALFSAANQIRRPEDNTLAPQPPTFVHWVTGSAEAGQPKTSDLRSMLFLSVVGLLIVSGWLLFGQSITDFLTVRAR